jgi:hypothetical protein
VPQVNEQKMKTANHVNVKEMSFDQLFKQISPEEIGDDGG